VYPRQVTDLAYTGFLLLGLFFGGTIAWGVQKNRIILLEHERNLANKLLGLEKKRREESEARYESYLASERKQNKLQSDFIHSIVSGLPDEPEAKERSVN
jgi:hypothetical protein